jgi:hypothetical protein
MQRLLTSVDAMEEFCPNGKTKVNAATAASGSLAIEGSVHRSSSRPYGWLWRSASLSGICYMTTLAKLALTGLSCREYPRPEGRRLLSLLATARGRGAVLMHHPMLALEQCLRPVDRPGLGVPSR